MIMRIRGLTKSFGGLVALDHLDFDLEQGEIRGVIGPNGSGKSTFFNLVSGVYKPDSGSILYEGHELASREPHQIARLGVARTFQMLRIWPEMTVLENLLTAHHGHIRFNPGALFNSASSRAEERRTREEMMHLLTLIGMADFADMPGAQTSIGQRRLISLGRAMAMKPRILMLDEPGAGLSPVNVEKLMGIILRLQREFGLTLIIVEHILKVIMDTCEKITVLDHGQKIAEGKPQQVKDDHKVIEAYLGKEMNDDEIRRELHA